MGRKKLGFNECLRYLEFKQYIKLCEILRVPLVNKEALRDEGDDAQLYRNDFDCMTQELQDNFWALPRRDRRQLMKYLLRVVNANKQARRYIEDGIQKKYSAATKALEEGILNGAESDT